MKTATKNGNIYIELTRYEAKRMSEIYPDLCNMVREELLKSPNTKGDIEKYFHRWTPPV